MQKGKGKSRIVAVNLGEARISLIGNDPTPLLGVFALVRDDGELVGRVDRRFDWSQRTLKALEELQKSMELDQLEHLFEGSQDDPEGDEPPQV